MIFLYSIKIENLFINIDIRILMYYPIPERREGEGERRSEAMGIDVRWEKREGEKGDERRERG